MSGCFEVMTTLCANEREQNETDEPDKKKTRSNNQKKNIHAYTNSIIFSHSKVESRKYCAVRCERATEAVCACVCVGRKPLSDTFNLKTFLMLAIFFFLIFLSFFFAKNVYEQLMSSKSSTQKIKELRWLSKDSIYLAFGFGSFLSSFHSIQYE